MNRSPNSLPPIFGRTIHPRHGHEWRCIAILKDGEFARAAEEARKLLHQPRPLARLVLAHALHELGETREAYEVLREAIAVCRPDADLFEALGFVADLLGEREEAMACQRAALRLDPTRAAAFSALARALLEAGRTGEFLEQARRAITWLPDAFEADAALFERYRDLVTRHDFDDRVLQRDPVPCAAAHPESNRLLFVSERPIAREWKLAQAMRARGFTVDLAIPEERALPYVDANAGFDAVHRFGRADDLISLQRDGRYRAGHYFIYKDYRTLARVLQRKPGPIVLDIYDPLSGMFSDEQLEALRFAEQARLERYCIESVDGIVCRDLRLQHVKRHFPVRFDVPLLFFPDYLSGAGAPVASTSTLKLRQSDPNALHLVHGGGINKRSWTQHEAAIMWMVKLANRHGAHVHVYAHNFATPGILDGYAEHARSNPRLHIHESVPPEHWISELAQYDAQLLVPRTSAEPWTHLGWSRANLELCSCNRIFDSVEAGVPIVGAREYGSMRWAERRGFGVTAHRRAMETAEFWEGLRRPALHDRGHYAALRRALAISRHAHRLEAFYACVVDPLLTRGSVEQASASSTKSFTDRGEISSRQVESPAPHVGA